MLTIRDAQIDAFRAEEWRSFLWTIEADARAALAARGDPRAREPLFASVEEAVRLAQRHGFRIRPHLARFARLVVVRGAGWATDAARAALGDGALDEDARLARLEAEG